MTDIAVIETHPVQYHAPVYRALHEHFGLSVTAIYGSDFSATGYRDPEFNAQFAWDSDLLSGYDSVFLSRVAEGGARDAESVRANGIRRALQRIDPKAVLLTGYSPAFYRRTAISALRFGKPIMFRAETTDMARQSKAKRFARNTMLRGLYHRFAALLYIGQRSREHYQRLKIDDDKLFFSPYCVDDAHMHWTEDDREAMRAVTRRQLRIDDDAIVLLFSGKFIARKNPSLIVDALRRLNGKYVAVFIGDGPLYQPLVQHSDAEPSVETRFLGFRNQSELSQYYHAADLFVLPSHFETWGLVVNEALLHGLPAIVTDRVGCAPDLVHQAVTGAIIPDDNADALARAIESWSTRLRSTHVREACRSTAQQYSTAAAARGIAQAFEAIS